MGDACHAGAAYLIVKGMPALIPLASIFSRYLRLAGIPITCASRIATIYRILAIPITAAEAVTRFTSLHPIAVLRARETILTT